MNCSSNPLRSNTTRSSSADCSVNVSVVIGSVSTPAPTHTEAYTHD